MNFGVITRTPELQPKDQTIHLDHEIKATSMYIVRRLQGMIRMFIDRICETQINKQANL